MTSYPKIPSSVKDGFSWDSQWFIQEKVDGSQITFQLDDTTGKVRAWCKGKEKTSGAQSFGPTVDALQSLAPLLDSSYTYHGEHLPSRRVNILTYDRVPRLNVVLYDVVVDGNKWLGPLNIATEAARLGLEMVSLLRWNLKGASDPLIAVKHNLQCMEERTLSSFLGGEPEGVVLKCYDPVGTQYRRKFVRDRFKEKRVGPAVTIRQGPILPPSQVLDEIGEQYDTEARLLKGIYRVRDRLNLKGCPPMTVPLYNIVRKELDDDLLAEWGEQIRFSIASGLTRVRKVVTAMEKHPEAVRSLPQNVIDDWVYKQNVMDDANMLRYTLAAARLALPALWMKERHNSSS